MSITPCAYETVRPVKTGTSTRLTEVAVAEEVVDVAVVAEEVVGVAVVAVLEMTVVVAGSASSPPMQPRPKPIVIAMIPSPIGTYSRMSFR